MLVVLLDDVGFAASSAFGGPCATPTAERLAAGGLKYNRFHTTALCAPTRAGAALRAQPPHRRDGCDHRDRDVGARATARSARTRARRSRRRSRSTATRPRSSASATRCRSGRPARWARSTPGRARAAASSTSTASSAARPTSTTRRSTRGRTPVEPEKTPEEGYHFTEDMTDKAIAWVRQQKALMPDKPFFVYFAPGATHAPHHVPTEWSDRYKGQFDDGWDALREETSPARRSSGSSPPDCELTAAPRGDPRLGRHARRAEAGPRPPDGDLRRLPRAHRPPHRPAHRHARGPRRPRRHAGLLHHRRQRRERRGDDQRHASTRCSC